MSIEILQQIPFQHSNFWTFSFTDSDPTLSFLVTSVDLPFKKFDVDTRNTGSKHYTKYTPEGEFSVTFRETIGFTSYNFLRDWFNNVYDNVNKVFRSGAAKYKTAILSFQATNTLLATINVKSFQFNNIQILSLQDLSLNYDSGENLMFSASFVADTVEEIQNSGVSFGDSPVSTELLKSIVNSFT